MVCIGVIGGAHGVRGHVRIRSFTHRPANVAAYGRVFDAGGERSFEVEVCGETKGQVIARIKGICDRSSAEDLRGIALYVPRSALPEPRGEEYYHADLIGLTVELAAEAYGPRTAIGRVRAVHDFGAGDVLEVELLSGASAMVPFTREAVPEVDVGGRRILVAPLAGVFEAADDDGSAPGAEEREE